MLNSLTLKTSAAVAAVALLSTPALAGAQTLSGSAPVAVQSVQVNNGEAEFEAAGRTPVPNTIDVHFENTSGKAASRIVFDVKSGSDDVGQIVDVGQFSPGTEIVKHYENTFDSVAPLEDASIAPIEVDYTDGSVWKAND